MASGSSGRPNSASKGFDFASDDILCSYDDFSNNENNNGSHSDPTVNKDFLKSRMARQSGYSAPMYNQQEDTFNQDLMSAVDKTMKKYADNLMRFLEGISSRLSQLELYCYNVDKSIGEMRADLVRDHEEADEKLKSLEKHVQEVHRSVQIIRDKQELVDTQKELAKLQLAQKDSSPSSHSQANEERASPPASDSKKNDNEYETHNQLALALPHQVAPQPQPQPQPVTHPSALSQAQPQGQQQTYYFSPSQLPNPSALTQHSQSQYMPSDPQYRTSQLQDPTRVTPQQAQSQVNQAPPVQYQQQWSHQTPPQVPPSQQPSVQTQMRPPSPAVYSPYPPNQAVHAPPQETLPSSMQMQVPYSGVPQSDNSRLDAMPYGYSGAGRTTQQTPSQPPPQPMKGSFGGQQNDRYITAGPQPTLPPGSTYMVYDSEGGRGHPTQIPHFQQGAYPPNAAGLPNIPPSSAPNFMIRNPSPSPPQYMRGHPYNELIEKLVSMGFRGDHAASVIQRMEESGQAVDFNAVLDRLSGHSSGSPQRGW